MLSVKSISLNEFIYWPQVDRENGSSQATVKSKMSKSTTELG